MTPLGQKGSPGKSGISRTTQRNQGCGGPHHHLVALLFYGWGIGGGWLLCSPVIGLVKKPVLPAAGREQQEA